MPLSMPAFDLLPQLGDFVRLRWATSPQLPPLWRVEQDAIGWLGRCGRTEVRLLDAVEGSIRAHVWAFFRRHAFVPEAGGRVVSTSVDGCGIKRMDFRPVVYSLSELSEAWEIVDV